MNIVLDAERMKSLDNYTINEIGLPSMVLMERAALEVANKVKEHVRIDDRILAVCGSGNNGADGIAAARILKLQGYDADVLMVGDINNCSNESAKQINIAENLGISIYNNVDINEYTVIIDGIFGIGLSKPLTGKYLDYISLINQGQHTVFSVDVPSGLSASTGKPLVDAIKANYTITFGYNKIGLILYPGCEYAGEVTVADIGFSKVRLGKGEFNYYTYSEADLSKLPIRKNDSHKGDYGKVLIIAGRVGMSGACYLASKAAYRMGSGLVKTLIPEDNRSIIQTMLPEAILSTYEGGGDLKSKEINQIIEDISWSNVIVIGPGLGVDNISKELLELVLKHAKVPLIIDADGINVLTDKLLPESINENTNKYDKNTIEDRIKVIKDVLPKNTILTPHLKELSRLLNIGLSEVQDNIFATANICTKDNSIIFAMKDARTIVASKGNRFINTTGNSGMSTAGSGDVLTGIIAGLIAQGLNPEEATNLGVFIHGLAGDYAAREKNQFSIIASDIIDGLAKI